MMCDSATLTTGSIISGYNVNFGCIYILEIFKSTHKRNQWAYVESNFGNVLENE